MSTNEQLTTIVNELANALVARIGNDAAVGEVSTGVEVLGTTTGETFVTACLPYSGNVGGIAVAAVNAEIAAQLGGLDAILTELISPLLEVISATPETIVPIDSAILLGRAEAAIATISISIQQGDAVVGSITAILENDGAESAEFESFDQTSNVTHIGTRSMDLLNDVEMGVAVELGRTRMSVKEILGLTPGSVVELDRAAGSAVDMLVNGTLVARGEVVVIDEEFGIRITEIIGHEDGKRAG